MTWHERNPERDPDPRIRAIRRDLFPAEGADVPGGGGYNEDTDGAPVVNAVHDPRGPRHHAVRRLEEATDRAFLAAGGWGVADAQADYGNDQRRGGITFREPEPGEFYVNEEVLRTGLEHRIGFKVEQIASVYVRGGGPISADLKALRDLIDARLLSVAIDGANMTALAALLGIGERTLDRALARARAAAEVQPC